MIKELQDKIRNGEITAVALTQKYLTEIKKRNESVGAYLTVLEEEALAQAEQIDKQFQTKGQLAALAGIPCAIKDNILVFGSKTTAGSKILENYFATFDATVIKKLKSAGAIILGKTNLDEFAMGSSTENSAFLKTKNPYDLERVPGGSSGGSAAAVAADLAVFALGSDTGGSIRQPAAFCGLVGFKPSYGAVSRFGLIALASSLDQIGPLTKTVEDAKIVFETISGQDEFDSTTEKLEVASMPEIKKMRIGVPREYFVSGIDEEIELGVRALLEKLQKAGADIREISLPHTSYALACYYIIMPAEASANLARYDSLRYAPLGLSAKGFKEIYFEARGKGFGPEPRRRIVLGTFVLSAGYYEAYYLKAQKVRQLIADDFSKAFDSVDFIITPTTPTPAFKLGDKLKDPVSMYLSDIFTVSANLAGLPAINLPIGFNKKGLPLGAQIIGPRFHDFTLLNFAQLVEKINNDLA